MADRRRHYRVDRRRHGAVLPLGLAAFAGACALILLRAAEEADALRRMPWPAILMVTGMSALVGVVERTGGMALFTTLLARLASPASVNGVIAFVTGVISTYSSTSGVVLPAFLPTVPGLVRELGGGDPLAIALEHQRRGLHRRRVTPLHAGRAVRGGDRGPRGLEGPLPPPDDLGPLDDGGGRAVVPGPGRTVRATLSPPL